MKIKCFLLFIVSVIFFSCSQEEVTDNVFDESGNTDIPAFPANLSKDDIISGVIRIKLEESAFNKFSVQTRSGEITTGIADMDKLAAMLGAIKIEPTFGIPGKCAPRWHKAGLDRWFDVYFDENIAVTRAYSDFTQIKGVSVVEPCLKIKREAYKTSERYTSQQLKQLLMTKTRSNTSENVSGFNDPGFSRQWHYYNDGSLPYAKAGADIDLVKAWKICTGNPEVIVDVVDDGIDITHQDLAANIWHNTAEINGEEGVDDDNNGYIDDYYGWNFYDNSATLRAGEHATHVAGTIAAVNNNGIGVAGIAGGDGTSDSGVKVMSTEIFAGDLFATDSKIAKAIVYGADNGAVISQNSWGGSSSTLSAALKEAINYFIEYAGMDETGEFQVGPMRGGIYIAAAGNANTSTVNMPGGYEKTFSVVAMGPDFEKASYSSYGDWTDITAPGGDTDRFGTEYGVLSTTPDNTYTYYEGTSMACPHVSGIAALAVAHFGVGKIGFTNSQLWNLLSNSVNDIYQYNPLYEGEMGSGYIDAYKVLSADVTYTDIAPLPVTDLAVKWNFNSVDLAWSVTRDNEDGTALYYDIAVVPGNLPTLNINQLPANAIKQTVKADGKKAGDVLSAVFNDLTIETSYTIAIVARDSRGNQSDVELLKGKTLNQAPLAQTLYTKLNILSMVDVGTHFDKDANISYSVINSHSDQLKVSVSEEGLILIKPLNYGIVDVTIRATDSKGVYVDYNITSVCRDDSQEIDLYPNPVVNVLNIRMEKEVEGVIKVELFNSRGLKVFSKEKGISPTQPASVDMSKMGSGSYTIYVTYNGVQIKRTIAKL